MVSLLLLTLILLILCRIRSRKKEIQRKYSSNILPHKSHTMVTRRLPIPEQPPRPATSYEITDEYISSPFGYYREEIDENPYAKPSECYDNRSSIQYSFTA